MEDILKSSGLLIGPDLLKPSSILFGPTGILGGEIENPINPEFAIWPEPDLFPATTLYPDILTY